MRKYFNLKTEWYLTIQGLNTEDKLWLLDSIFKANLGVMVIPNNPTQKLLAQTILSHYNQKPEREKSSLLESYSKEVVQESEKFVKWISEVSMKHSTYVRQAIKDNKKKERFQSIYCTLRKNYEKDQIKEAIEYAVNDEFWKSNFLSPAKLNEKNVKAGMKHIDLFLSKKATKAPKTVQKQVEEQVDRLGLNS